LKNWVLFVVRFKGTMAFAICMDLALGT